MFARIVISGGKVTWKEPPARIGISVVAYTVNTVSAFITFVKVE